MTAYREDYTVDDDGTGDGALIDHVEAVEQVYPCTPVGVASSVRDFFAGLLAVFTPRFTMWAAMNYGLIKGMAYLGITYVQLPYFKGLGVSGSEYQKFFNISQMAFALKPAIGVISDSIPILGYHKRYYVLACCIIGSLSLVGVNMLPNDISAATAAAALLFLFMAAVATLDLLGEGKYSELMARDTTGRGPSMVTWVWMCYMSGGLAAAAIEGTVAESLGARAVIWMIMPLTMSHFVPTLLGWLPETKLQPATATVSVGNTNSNKGRFKLPSIALSPVAQQHKGTLALGFLASTCALMLAALSLLASRTIVLVGLILMSVATLGSSFLVLPATIAKANLFMFLKELCYWQINGDLDYFYTANEQCVPGGPNFSYSYYQSLGNIVANLAGFAGTIIFQKFFLKGTYRFVFWCTTFLKIFASAFDIIIVKRWNVDAGIPDKAAYIFGDAIVYQLTTMLDFMPSVVLNSRLCPKGMEATIYALLAGVSNFGQVSSRTIGYMVSEWLEIKTVVPCDFTNLPYLIVIGHMLMPLLLLPLTFLLLPPNKMSEPVTDIEDRPADQPATMPREVGLNGELLGADDADDVTVSKNKKVPADPVPQYAVFAADAAVEAAGSTSGGGESRPSSVAGSPTQAPRPARSTSSRTLTPPRRRAGSISESQPDADASLSEM